MLTGFCGGCGLSAMSAAGIRCSKNLRMTLRSGRIWKVPQLRRGRSFCPRLDPPTRWRFRSMPEIIFKPWRTLWATRSRPGFPQGEGVYRLSVSGTWASSLPRQELKLDLAHAEVDLPHGKITLHGAGGVERVIPVDANGYFYVNWRVETFALADREPALRRTGCGCSVTPTGLRNDFQGKLVVVGSAAQGNDLTDRGRRRWNATPFW